MHRKSDSLVSHPSSVPRSGNLALYRLGLTVRYRLSTRGGNQAVTLAAALPAQVRLLALGFQSPFSRSIGLIDLSQGAVFSPLNRIGPVARATDLLASRGIATGR